MLEVLSFNLPLKYLLLSESSSYQAHTFTLLRDCILGYSNAVKRHV